MQDVRLSEVSMGNKIQAFLTNSLRSHPSKPSVKNTQVMGGRGGQYHGPCTATVHGRSCSCCAERPSTGLPRAPSVPATSSDGHPHAAVAPASRPLPGPPVGLPSSASLVPWPTNVLTALLPLKKSFPTPSPSSATLRQPFSKPSRRSSPVSALSHLCPPRPGSPRPQTAPQTGRSPGA